MLDPADFHRKQCAVYLRDVTLVKFSDALSNLGILEDFKLAVESIADHQKVLNKEQLTNGLAKTYKLELKSEQDK